MIHIVKEDFSHRINYHLLTEMDTITSDSAERDSAILQEHVPVTREG